ncbi:MAG: CDP-glycerol glycerophosphotransferase family protein [Clostridia bacterium]|nr:CDP-glycerol glycerophosphotransferase family protein [Clostridia bacterium]
MNILNTFSAISRKLTDAIPRKNIIIFESGPAFSDNTYWYYKYLIENTDISKKYKLVWVVPSKEQFRAELLGKKITCIIKTTDDTKEKIRFAYYTRFAKFIIDSNDYIRKKHPAQKRVFLGHGMPVKIVMSYNSQKGEVDLNPVTSYVFNSHFYDCGDTEDNIRDLGYCRADILASNAGKRKNSPTKYIIWMPTYRQHKNGNNLAIKNKFPLGLPVIKSHEEMAQINECLKENNVILYLRPHPAQDVSVMQIDEMSNIVIADGEFINKKGVQLYEFLTETDALITDYSSVYYDYLMLERPIALAVEDFDDFTSKWEMFYNTFDEFKENYKCPYLYTVDDLKKFIKDVATDNDEFEQDRINARNKFYTYPDNKACERLYKYMKQEYGL